MTRVFAAVDIGASGGRVMAGVVDGGIVTLQPIHRFANSATQIDGHLRWDIVGLYEEVLIGLARLSARYPQVESIGIDTWAVDYGLLDAAGELMSAPIAYRDPRTDRVIDEVHQRVSPAELYATTGVQFLAFTTIYQLAAERDEPHWPDVAHIVLLPDLLAYWLTGVLATEATNASTTGLVDIRTGTWSAAILGQIDVAPSRLAPIEAPGSVRAVVRPELCARLGIAATTVVTTVASHDTASAVVAVPATDRHCAYIASGTWSLVGLELDQPILSDASRAANFTNERGVDGRTRFLRNVGGLWLLQECLRTWTDEATHEAARDARVDATVPVLDDLIAAAAGLDAGGPTVAIHDATFLAPGAMPERIAAACSGPAPMTAAQIVRCIIDSLAAAYAATIAQAHTLAAASIDTVHIVGGGSQNALLCQLTADQCGLAVTAGPVEATALGNILVQARAHDATPGTLEDLRSIVIASTPIVHYEPHHLPERHP